jgi:hypothetical protein
MINCVVCYLSAAAIVLETRRNAWPGQFRRWRDALQNEDGAAARIDTSTRDADSHRRSLAKVYEQLANHLCHGDVLTGVNPPPPTHLLQRSPLWISETDRGAMA